MGETFVRTTASARLAGASAAACGAFSATVIGAALFPQIDISSPDTATFAIAGAAAGGIYWTIFNLLRQAPDTPSPADCLRVCPAILLAGVVAGGLVGFLSSGVFLGILLGLVGSLLLAGPYLAVAIVERHRRKRRVDR